MSSHRDITQAIEASGNRFALVTVVRKRAVALAHGAAPRTVTTASKPVTIAIQEVARGRMGPIAARSRPTPVLEPGPLRELACATCGEIVVVRRKAGVAVAGRPPTRCHLHGLSANWEQLIG